MSHPNKTAEEILKEFDAIQDACEIGTEHYSGFIIEDQIKRAMHTFAEQEAIRFKIWCDKNEY